MRVLMIPLDAEPYFKVFEPGQIHGGYIQLVKWNSEVAFNLDPETSVPVTAVIYKKTTSLARKDGRHLFDVYEEQS